MIKDLKIAFEFHSYQKDEHGLTYSKYHLSVSGEYNGKKKYTMTALRHTDPPLEWIEALYEKLVDDFEKEERENYAGVGMKEHKYILDENKNPIACPDTFTWANFYEDINNRRVSQTTLPNDIWVSTVFLGVNHNFFGDGAPPILFETMVEGSKGWLEELTRRYETWEEAEKGHKEIVDQFIDANNMV